MDGELGAFLRSRREARRPVEVGLPEGPRRRTPGLRRAELATLAQVSVEYLTRLEQGAPFVDRWRQRPVTAARTGLLTVRHPAAGLLRLNVETLELAEADPQRLVVQLPADAATAIALDQLAGRRPGQLRAVAG
ncbi:MmyB family transcriptional regulator [Micromonospora zamorensis]|uniref:MmyB family transcriptional regulator n=1 Tax=Micromonospora zamorensis TaxID=709883 RepID=UPI0037B9056A